MIPRFMSRARLVPGLALAALALPLTALAQSKPKDLTTYVQMAGVTVVAVSASGQRSTIPTTVVLHVTDVDAAREICRRIPSVRAAIVASASRTPIPYVKGKLDSDTVSNIMTTEINTAIERKAVLRVGIIHGTPKHRTDTITDLVDPGDVTGEKQTMKAGAAAQNVPCRLVPTPPGDLGWNVVEKPKDKYDKSLTPTPPLLREERPRLAPVPVPETHPQFAPKK